MLSGLNVSEYRLSGLRCGVAYVYWRNGAGAAYHQQYAGMAHPLGEARQPTQS